MRKSEFNPPRSFASQALNAFVLIAGALVLSGATAFAQSADATNASLSQLADLDITNLMNIKVSIVSGEPQTIPQTPAAVSVVTQDDIRRSGAQNFPEALRLVPGMDVAQLDSSQWAVSARGFNDVFADKLLVMQDGRSIYTPLFAGVLWDVQGTMMQDVDHIEVIRGPGATLWGANAMNGVINIITKSSEDTQGLLVNGGGGLEERGFEGARYGGKINDNAYYRVYETYENHDSTELWNGNDANNSWQTARGGFRTDWKPTDENSFTFQGDGYAGWIDQVFDILDPSYNVTTNAEQMKVSGANTLGRWTHTFSDTSNFKLQMYYDYTGRQAPNVFDEQRHTFDLDFKHQFAIGERNNIVWGLGYRVTADSEKNNQNISFYMPRQTVNLYSAFLQDEIAIVPDRLRVTLGSKFEDNDYTGFEVEPGGRILWMPTERQTIWASVSRAVRTPSRAEESVILRQPFLPGIPLTILGTNTFQSENLIAYEIGYRTEPIKNLSFDLTAFWNHYDNLRSQRQPNPLAPTVYLANDLYGDTYGGEISATWRVMDWWRLQPSYSLLKMHLHANTVGGSADSASVALDEGASPQNQFAIRSSMDLPHDVTFDTMLRFVDRLQFPQASGAMATIPDYFELSTRLAWRINEHWEIAIVGQNLLHNRHSEFMPTYVPTQPTEIPRSIFAQITCRF